MHGVFVPAGGGRAEVLDFRATLTVHAQHGPPIQCLSGVRPLNYQPNPAMQESLGRARQACLDRLAPRYARVWSCFRTPFLASPDPARGLLVAAALAVLIFSMGSAIGLCLWRPASWVILAAACGFLSFWLAVVLVSRSLPRTVLPDGLSVRSIVRAITSQFGELYERLEGKCFDVSAGDPHVNRGQFYDESASLAFFSVFVTAVTEARAQSIFMPWQQNLVNEMKRGVASAILKENGDLGQVERLEDKLSAIRQHNRVDSVTPFSIAIFSKDDETNVKAIWWRVAGGKLDPQSEPVSGCTTATSQGLTFLFCPNLDAFLRYFNRWRWRWLIARAGLLLSPLVLVPVVALCFLGPVKVSVTITIVPPRGGGSNVMDTIAGQVLGADPVRHRIVIFSRAGDQWYVQPWAQDPFTPIESDGSWRTRIHLGDEYTALLVETLFKPPDKVPTLPAVGGSVLAKTSVPAR